MTPERWQQIRLLYDDLVQTPRAEQGAALLARCAGDADLAAAVERLLEQHANEAGFMAAPTVWPSAVDAAHASHASHASPAAPGAHGAPHTALPGGEHAATPSGRAAPWAAGLQPGNMVGRYKVVRHLGEGAFGDVFEAEQERPTRMRVGLKMLKPVPGQHHAEARFRQEQRALAVMKHPNIATIHDSGITPDGRPYFVMEFVDGLPITQFADQHRLPIAARLTLFTQVCAAVAYAHSKGVIHRDLKPGNILVSGTPDRALVKVLDFGIAKVTDAACEWAGSLLMVTEQPQIVGTPEYMSPEQAMQANDIGTHSDVYALGVLLYELLTGFLPFEGLRRMPIAAMQRVLRDDEPPPLTRRIQAAQPGEQRRVSDARSAAAGPLTSALRGELSWIVLKAMSKEPARRYVSPALLADDIERHLRGDPVHAAPPGWLYRMRKFVRKQPVLLAAACVTLFIAIGATVAIVHSAREANMHAKSALASLRISEAGRLATLSMQAGPTMPQVRVLLAAEAIAAADPVQPESVQALINALPGIGGMPFHGHTAPLVCAAFSPNGSHLVTASRDGTARVYDLTAPDPTRNPCVLRGHTGSLTWASFSPDGCSVATAGGDGTVRVWDLAAADPAVSPLVLEGHGDGVMHVTFSPCGRLLATSSKDCTARIWDLDSPDPAANPIILAEHEHWVPSIAFSSDGRRLLTSSCDRQAHVWEIDRTGWKANLFSAATLGWPISPVAFSADGQRICSGGSRCPVWHLLPGGMAPAMPPSYASMHDDGACIAATLSPSGDSVAVACRDGFVRVHSFANRVGADALLPITPPTFAEIAYSPDGRLLAANSDARTIRVWNLAQPDPAQNPVDLRGHDARVVSIAFNHDGSRLVTASEDGTARVWDTTASAPASSVDTIAGYGRGRTRTLLFGPGGNSFFTTTEDGALRVWWHPAGADAHTLPTLLRIAKVFNYDTTEAAPGTRSLRLGTWGFAPRMCQNRDRTLLAVVARGIGIFLWRVCERGTLTELASHIYPAEAPLAVAMSPDGHRLAVAYLSGRVDVHALTAEDPLTLQCTFQYPHEGVDPLGVNGMCFSPDGARLLTVGNEGDMQMWALDGSAPPARIHRTRCHGGEWGLSCAFSPDGQRVLTTGADKMARVWRTRPDGSMTLELELRGHDDWVTAGAFSSTGDRVGTTSYDGTTRVWALPPITKGIPPAAAGAPGHPLAVTVLPGSLHFLTSIDFGTDGTRVAVDGADDMIQIWDLDIDHLCERAERTIGRDMTPDEWRQYFPGKPYRSTWQHLRHMLQSGAARAGG